MIRRKRTIVLLLLLLVAPTSGSVKARNLRWQEMRRQRLITFDWNCSHPQLFPKKILGNIVRKAIPPDDRGKLGTYGDRAFTTRLTSSGQTIYFVPLDCGATG